MAVLGEEVLVEGAVAPPVSPALAPRVALREKAVAAQVVTLRPVSAWAANRCRLWAGPPRSRGPEALPTPVLTDVWHGNWVFSWTLFRQAGHCCKTS